MWHDFIIENEATSTYKYSDDSVPTYTHFESSISTSRSREFCSDISRYAAMQWMVSVCRGNKYFVCERTQDEGELHRMKSLTRVDCVVCNGNR